MSSLKVFTRISSPVYVTINPGTSSVVAFPFCLVELWLAIFWALQVHKIFLFSRCRERKRFFMPPREFVVQFKTRKNFRLTIKNAFVCF